MPERYLSEVLQSFPGIAHHAAPLIGVEAVMYNRLWRAIIVGKLKPGTKLREEVIGETFEVSRTVVRKVLVIMEQEGIVELPLNRGAYLATPTPQDAKDIIEATRLVSVHIASELAKLGRTLIPDNLDRLKRHIAFQAASEASDDFAQVRIISSEFLVLLVHIHGNRLFAAQFENLITRLVIAAAVYQRGERVLRAGADFQTRLLAHILNHEPQAAVKLMADFYQAVERSFLFEVEDDEIDLRAILMPKPVETRPATPSKRYGKRKQVEVALK